MDYLRHAIENSIVTAKIASLCTTVRSASLSRLTMSIFLSSRHINCLMWVITDLERQYLRLYEILQSFFFHCRKAWSICIKNTHTSERNAFEIDETENQNNFIHAISFSLVKINRNVNRFPMGIYNLKF